MRSYFNCMKVKKVLSRDIIKIRNDAPVLEAARLMFHNQISAVLVVDANDSLVGLLSEKDIYRALYPSYTDFYTQPEAFLDYEKMESKASQIKQLPVEKFMSKNLYTVSEDDPLMKVGAIMLSKNVNRLPVLNSDGKLVGIVSRREIYQELLRDQFV